MDKLSSAKQYAVDYGENAHDDGFTMPGQLQSTEDESRYSQYFFSCPFHFSLFIQIWNVIILTSCKFLNPN